MLHFLNARCMKVVGESGSKTHQDDGKFLLQLRGVRHGHLQGHDVMLHRLRLAVRALDVPHCVSNSSAATLNCLFFIRRRKIKQNKKQKKKLPGLKLQRGLKKTEREKKQLPKRTR